MESNRERGGRDRGIEDRYRYSYEIMDRGQMDSERNRETEAASPVRLVRPWPDHFQRVVGLVPRLQRRSEDETIWPGVPRKLAFAVRVHVSRNRSRSFTGGPGARRGPTGLHRRPRVAKYTCVYDVQLLAIWRILYLSNLISKRYKAN